MNGIPAQIGRYRVVSRIGRGGMGALYLAWDPTLERQVAIKILIDDNDELRERFSREARSAARLHHPNIVTMYDVGEDDGRPFMAMEYIQGQTLAEIIRKNEPLTIVRKLQLAEALVDGLAFAHKAGVIHRDVKPANLMVDISGALKILDFGIARIAEYSSMTQAGALIGTLNYMSPEQLTGHGVDRRSDIFSVGAVCYELLSYRQAFPGGLDSGILQKLLQSQTEPLAVVCPTLDADIVRIVHRCLEADVQKRYQDLESTLRDLGRVRFRLASQEPRSGPDIAKAAPEPAPPSGRLLRRALDLEGLAQRRSSQIQAYLKAANDAHAAADYDAAIIECERVLMLDADQTQAIELLERAKTALDERQAEQILVEAEGDIKRGALSAAMSKIEQATALSPLLPRVAQVRAVADEAIREREAVRQRAEKIRALMARAHASFDNGQFAEAVAAVDEALALNPDHAEANAVKTRALDAIDAQAREELARRARDCVREARRRFNDSDHAGAVDLLARFEPSHELVSQALEELRAESLRIAEQRRIEAEQRARRQRIETALASARDDIEHERFGDALDRLHALAGAEGDSPAISALIETAEAGQAELERLATLARAVAESVAKASGLFARNDLQGALTRIESALALDPGHGPALALHSKIQEALRVEVERHDARERRMREREQAITAALDRARQARSPAIAIDALYTALEIDPEHAEVRRLLDEWEQRVAREEAERRAVQDVERARREQIEKLLGSAMEALHRDDVAEARRIIRQMRDSEPESLEAQWLESEIVATHGSAVVTEPSTPVSALTAPDIQPPAGAKPLSTSSASPFPVSRNVGLAVGALIVVLLLLVYFVMRR